MSRTAKNVFDIVVPLKRDPMAEIFVGIIFLVITCFGIHSFDTKRTNNNSEFDCVCEKLWIVDIFASVNSDGWWDFGKKNIFIKFSSAFA